LRTAKRGVRDINHCTVDHTPWLLPPTWLPCTQLMKTMSAELEKQRALMPGLLADRAAKEVLSKQLAEARKELGRTALANQRLQGLCRALQVGVMRLCVMEGGREGGGGKMHGGRRGRGTAGGLPVAANSQCYIICG
jgi:hypothetical protein